MHESSIGVASLYTRTSMNPNVSRPSAIRGRGGGVLPFVLYITGVTCTQLGSRSRSSSSSQVVYCRARNDSRNSWLKISPGSEEVRHASRNADSACPFLHSLLYKKGHAESAIRDA